MSEPAEAVAPLRMTYEEYVEWEQTQLERHEFHDGEVLAMSGGTVEHGLINTNAAGELRHLLKGRPCRVFGGDVRVRQPPQFKGGSPRYVYPDVSVVCGKAEMEPPAKGSDRLLTLLNPLLIVETLSDSTQSYDRGEKFFRYINIPSLREYVLVWQSPHRVESFLRGDDGTWSLAFWDGLEAVARLRSLEIDLPLAEVYARTDFDADE